MAQQQSEAEILVEELETRVERLRALYEMYFMGIEKVEPLVPRKDVDRRLYVLRRTQMRNTALRFRFQNVLLRYNTYQTYWMRVARKIEEGTYKRDVRRANARFSNPVKAKARDGATELRDEDLEELLTASGTEPPVAPSSAESLDGEELSFDVDLEEDDGPRGKTSWLEDLQSGAVLRPAPVPKDVRAPEAPPAPRRGPLEGMQTQPEIWIGKGAGKPVAGKPTTARPSSRPAPRRPSSVPPRVPPAQPAGGVRYAQGPQARRSSDIPIPRPGPVGQPAVPAGARPGAGTTVGPASRAQAAAPPASPTVAGPIRRKSRPGMPKVEVPKAPAPAVAHAPPRAPSSASGLSDERVRQIYTQYVETKRSLKESTASLTYDNLARSLRDSSEKLRTKHTGKSVDFEVTVKDGRTILRPVVK